MKKLERLFSVVLILCLSLSLEGRLVEAAADGKKQEYYQKYQKICEEVNQETKQSISLLPLKEIKDEDFMDPAAFEKTVKDISKAEFHNVSAAGNILKDPCSLSGKFSKTKSFTVKVNDTKFVEIECKITGTYYYDKTLKRCFFGKVNKPAYTVLGGNWGNRGYVQDFIDGSRTACIEMQGKAVAGSNYSKKFSRALEFYCTEEGKIK